MMSSTDHRSTGRALDILQLLAGATEGYTLSQITESLHAPKSSLFPIVHTLCERRFLSYDPAGQRYRIGPAAFSVGMSFLSSTDALKQVEKEMEQIVEQCSETVHFAVLDSGNVVYLLKKDSPQAIRMTSTVGLSLPAYGTGIGKALLIDHSMDQLRATYPHGLLPLTENTITDFAALAAQLHGFKQDDISHEYEESNLHIRCVGVALRKNGRIVAGLSVAAPIFRCDDERINSIRELLLKAKQRLEPIFEQARLDFAPPAITFPD